MADIFLRKSRLWVKGRRSLTLDPVHPSAAFRASYQAKLDRIIAELNASIVYWVKANWRKQPTLAQDAPVTDLRLLFRRLGKRWLKQFDKLAPDLAAYFAQKTEARVSGRLRDLLRENGMSVEFVMSKKVRNTYQAVIAENVGLIKSIASQYLASVEQEVMRSVASGRDLATLTDTLQKQYHVTRRRAALIARDQNNKATAVITKARQQELGITHAKWRHSAGGNHPRPSHVAMNGQIYEIEKGLYDPDEKKYVLPGELINCRCVSQAVIPGFE